MILKTASDWHSIRKELDQYFRRTKDGVPYLQVTHETAKVIENMASMVAEISKAEVKARQTGNRKGVDRLIAEFNAHLDQIEQLLFIRMLEDQ